MAILGIETSCDETSAAIVQDGAVKSNVVTSQLFHEKYGGVVPELASRAHMKLIVPIVNEALEKAGVNKEDLNAVAATYGPGLIGSILVGLNFGKSYAYGLGIPFIGVNHMEAHLLSNFLVDSKPAPEYPFVCLTVSGGHTQLVYVRKPFDYEMLGQTRDDAAGEAYDKVAKMLGLGFPGGPIIDRLAREGDPKFVNFPRPYLDEDSFDFSFSGLKTSVLYWLKRQGLYGNGSRASQDSKLMSNLCASFQAAVVEVLVQKTIRAAGKFDVNDVCIAGGVSANSELRSRMSEETKKRGLRLHCPPMEFCTDNGAMIAYIGFLKLRAGLHAQVAEVTAVANLQLT